MSDFHHPMTEQKSRKVQQCVYCAYAIERGETYRKQSGVFDGSYYTNRYHVACWNALIEECRYYGDWEFSPGQGHPPATARTMQEARAAAAMGGNRE